MPAAQRLTTVLLTGALCLSLAVSAFAQQGRRGSGGGGGPFPPSLIQQLNLTEEQQAKVRSAGEALRAEQEKARALGTPREKRQAGRAAREKYEAAVKAVLNADQQKKLAAVLQEARELGIGPLGMQLAGLNLTSEQKEKIRGITGRYQPELQKLRASQKGASDRKAIQGQIREQNQKMMGEIHAVLTPEQQKQLAPAGRQRRAGAKRKNGA